MSLFRRKDSSNWWVKITIRGMTIQESTGTANKLAAQKYHDWRKSELWNQKRLGIKSLRNWHEAVTRWLLETSGKATHKEDKAKLKWLDSYLGNLTLDEITSDVIMEIKQARLKEASKSTANRYLALVRSILKRAVDDWEWIDKMPKVKLFKEPEGRTRFISPGQVQALLRELPQHQRDVVMFALLTGLRQSNVLKLEWRQVDLDRAHVWIEATQSKNRKPIAVPLNREAVGVLQSQIGKHSERVFTYEGKPLNRANTKAWRNALIRAGIEDFRWHDLRHTWASWHRMQGTPTHELQQLGGWKTCAMVERYAHLSSEHLANAASRLDSVLIGYDSATMPK